MGSNFRLAILSRKPGNIWIKWLFSAMVMELWYGRVAHAPDPTIFCLGMSFADASARRPYRGLKYEAPGSVGTDEGLT